MNTTDMLKNRSGDFEPHESKVYHYVRITTYILFTVVLAFNLFLSYKTDLHQRSQDQAILMRELAMPSYKIDQSVSSYYASKEIRQLEADNVIVSRENDDLKAQNARLKLKLASLMNDAAAKPKSPTKATTSTATPTPSPTPKPSDTWKWYSATKPADGDTPVRGISAEKPTDGNDVNPVVPINSAELTYGAIDNGNSLASNPIAMIGWTLCGAVIAIASFFMGERLQRLQSTQDSSIPPTSTP